MNKKVLFIGGSGVISSACSQLCIEKGIELSCITRGRSVRPLPDEVNQILADIYDIESVLSSLKDRYFDAVVDWIAFEPDHVERDIRLFRDMTDQYIFISTASAYQTPPKSLPITESTTLYNPFWEYSRNKIACEDLLVHEYRENGFPMTIVRPSHTYDKTMLPFRGRYTVIDRMLHNKKVLVNGDGTSLWTLTHHRDFAKGLVGLLGNPQAIGETFHITSDEILTWNQIFDIVASAANTVAQKIHVPSEYIAAYDHDWGSGLLGDKTHSVIFDNSKIKRLVPDFKATIPFEQGAREIIAWYNEDPARKVIDQKFNEFVDFLIEKYQSILP